MKFKVAVCADVDIINGFHIKGECAGKSVKVYGVGVDEFDSAEGFDFVINVGYSDDNMVAVVCRGFDSFERVIDGIIIDEHPEVECEERTAFKFCEEGLFLEMGDQFGLVIRMHVLLYCGNDVFKEGFTGFINAEFFIFPLGEEFRVMFVICVNVIEYLVSAGERLCDLGELAVFFVLG